MTKTRIVLHILVMRRSVVDELVVAGVQQAQDLL